MMVSSEFYGDKRDVKVYDFCPEIFVLFPITDNSIIGYSIVESFLSDCPMAQEIKLVSLSIVQ